MAMRRSSVAEQNAAAVQRSASVTSQVVEQASWIERKLRPTKVTSRYPIKGKGLLFATCGFGSLGDALFGYNSGNSCGIIPYR